MLFQFACSSAFIVKMCATQKIVLRIICFAVIVFISCLEPCVSEAVRIYEYYDCGNGEYIGNAGRCDGGNDCGNGADELDCDKPCPRELFDCHNGHCVRHLWRCDGDNDCGNGVDEEDCDLNTNSEVSEILETVEESTVYEDLATETLEPEVDTEEEVKSVEHEVYTNDLKSTHARNDGYEDYTEQDFETMRIQYDRYTTKEVKVHQVSRSFLTTLAEDEINQTFAEKYTTGEALSITQNKWTIVFCIFLFIMLGYNEGIFLFNA